MKSNKIESLRKWGSSTNKITQMKLEVPDSKNNKHIKREEAIIYKPTQEKERSSAIEFSSSAKIKYRCTVGNNNNNNNNNNNTSHSNTKKAAFLKKFKAENSEKIILEESSNVEINENRLSDLQKISDRIELLKKYNYEELEKLYASKRQPSSISKNLSTRIDNNNNNNNNNDNDNNYIGIIAVDPAPLTCAFVLIDMATGEILNFDIRAFRSKDNPIADTGKNYLCDRATEYADLIDCPCLLWAVEDQVAHTLYTMKHIKNEFFCHESHDIQILFKGMMRKRLIPIRPSDVKHFFGFKKVDKRSGETEESRRKRQYYENKTSVHIYGEKYLTKEQIRKVNLIQRNCPDIYDAILTGQYLRGIWNGDESYTDQRKKAIKHQKEEFNSKLGRMLGNEDDENNNSLSLSVQRIIRKEDVKKC